MECVIMYAKYSNSSLGKPWKIFILNEKQAKKKIAVTKLLIICFLLFYKIKKYQNYIFPYKIAYMKVVKGELEGEILDVDWWIKCYLRGPTLLAASLYTWALSFMQHFSAKLKKNWKIVSNGL